MNRQQFLSFSETACRNRLKPQPFLQIPSGVKQFADFGKLFPFGALETNRTSDLPLRRGLLYPLSYQGGAAFYAKTWDGRSAPLPEAGKIKPVTRFPTRIFL